MTDIYLFGMTLMTKLLITYLETDARYSLLGITVNKQYCSDSEFFGIPVIPFEVLPSGSDNFGMINCVGSSEQLGVREFICSQIEDKKLNLLSYFHPDAIVEGVEFRQSCIVLNRAVIEPYSKVGKGNIFYGGCYICHDASIGDYNWFSTGCVLAGKVQVGNRNFIGINASIRNGVTIGTMTTVGMGAVVVRDVKDSTVVFGNPAVERELKKMVSCVSGQQRASGEL